MINIFKSNKKSPWRDITINKYYKLQEIATSDQDELHKKIEIVALLNDIPVEQLYDLPLTELSKLDSDFRWLQEFPLNDNSRPPKTITIDANKYNIETDFTKFTVAQYIDFQTFWSYNDLKKYYGNILACFVIPEGHQYGTDYSTQELAELLCDSIDILTANEIVFFSLKRSAKLMSDFLTYLNLMMKTKKTSPEIIERLAQLRNLYLDGLTLLTSTQK